MRRLGYDGLVEFRVDRSVQVLAESGERYDLIFLDGDHRLKRAGWPIEVLPLGELPWPTKLGTSRTSLALLGR